MMSTDAVLELANLLLVVFVGFLIWYVKQFLAAQIKSYTDEFGKIDARLAKIDELARVEQRLKQVAADVELATKRALDAENLARTKNLDFRERQLSEFYWPLYVRLQMDNAVWKWLGNVLPESPATERKIGGALEENFVLPNHRAAVDLIRAKIHLVEDDPELEALLLQYVRHVAIYDALRGLGIRDRDPISLGEPWPENLFARIELHTKRLQAEFLARIRETVTH